jgi:uncharacterized repeat protein (TIGR01451 family)
MLRPRKRLILIILTLLVLIGLFISRGVETAAAETTFTIANGDVNGLIAAIQAANSDPEPDTILLAPGGTYTLNAPAEDDRGLPLITSIVTIDGRGATIRRQDGSTPNFGLLRVLTSGDLTLHDVRLEGGSPTIGGAIWNEGILKVSDSEIVDNDALIGGGIFNSGSNVTITGTTFRDNNGGLGAGAFYNNVGAGAVIVDSLFEDNGGGDGGGIINAGGASLTLVSTTFSGQVSNGDGGAIYNASTALLNIANSTFFNNTASEIGGAIYAFEGAVSLTHVTFSDNKAGDTGGLYTFGTTLSMRNTIIAGSANGDCSSLGVSTNINNWVEDGSCFAAFSGDPLLEDALDHNGGFTPTLAPQENSPVINLGANAGWNVDQRGSARPARGGFDLGAYELGTLCTAICYVDGENGNDTNGGTSWFDALRTIQTGVDYVSVNGEVRIAAGIYNESVVVEKSGIRIFGAGRLETRLTGGNDDCDAPGPLRIGLRIAGGTDNITISDLRLAQFVTGILFDDDAGNYNFDTTIRRVNAVENCLAGVGSRVGTLVQLTLDDVDLSRNGQHSFGTDGVGVRIEDGLIESLTIRNSEINNNGAYGIHLIDNISVSGLRITNNEILGNGYAGALITGVVPPFSNRIDNNSLTNNGLYGLLIADSQGDGQASGSGSFVIEDNFVTNTLTPASGQDTAGIAVIRLDPKFDNPQTPTGIYLRDNAINGYQQPGEGDGYGVVLEGLNHVYETSTANGHDVGLLVQQGAETDRSFDLGSAAETSGIIVRNANFQQNLNGVWIIGDAGVQFTGVAIFDNENDGILADDLGFTPRGIINSQICANGGFGLRNLSGVPFTATGNWWGSFDGPSGVGPGVGDEVSSDVIFSPFTSSVSSSVCTALGPFADVGITKSDGLDEADPGDPITYTIHVTNFGPTSAPGVYVVDTYPDGLNFVSYTATRGTYVQFGRRWDIGQMSVGETATLLLTFEVADYAAGDLTNVAEAFTDAGDPDPENNIAEDTTTINPLPGGLELHVDASVPTATVGDTVTFTYRLINTGEIGLAEVAIISDRFGAVALPFYNVGPGLSVEGTFDYTIQASDLPGPLVESAYAFGSTVNLGQLLEDTDDASVQLTPITACAPGDVDPETALSGWIETGGGTATGYITNNSDRGCLFQIGLASYRKFDDNIDSQVIYDSEAGNYTIEAGQTIFLTVDVPDCAAQIDLFYGPLIAPVFNGARYGTRLLAAIHLGGENYCQPDQPPTPTEAPTPEPQPTPEVTPDTDGDGLPDDIDPDIDGDGLLNDADPDPYVFNDLDGDGIGDGFDDDIDGDGDLNVDELAVGTDPRDASSFSIDHDMPNDDQP